MDKTNFKPIIEVTQTKEAEPMDDRVTEKPVLDYDSRTNPYFPHQVLMESTSACQLRCAMCAREDALKKGALKIGHMEEWVAVKIIEEVAQVNPKARLWFCFFGEPTISKDLARRIRMAKDKGIENTIINSNGNLLTPKICDQLIDSGLDEIYIGLDAATPETYAKVRVRGDYNTVVGNIHYLLKHKKDNLKITVQFGVYQENEHELELFKKYWTEVGIPIYIRPKITWIGTLAEHRPSQDSRHACAWILDSFAIYHDGLVAHCICDWENRFPQGDIKKQSIAEVWQTSFRRLHNLHLSKRWDELPEFCQKCPDWRTKPLKGNLELMNQHRWTFEDVHIQKPSHVKTIDFFPPASDLR